MTALHFAHDKGLSFCKIFANDEGDEPSRVGAAMDPLMDGMEQLDTVISFRDGGPGIARELQPAASRGQASRSERNLMQAFRDISSWCDQHSLSKTISDIEKQSYKRSDEEKLLRGKNLDALLRHASLSWSLGPCSADIPRDLQSYAWCSRQSTDGWRNGHQTSGMFMNTYLLN